jgi:hypothetical protein
MSRAEETVRGAAPNVDTREIDAETPFDRDTDDRRVIGCYCCSCERTATILAEPGRTREWEHAGRHPTHVIDYWRED